MDRTIEWLLEGDVSIQYQTRRDLCGDDDGTLQARIATEGWGKRYLELMNPDGSWARGFYQPKWTSSHYTLLELRNLCLPRDTKGMLRSVEKILAENKAEDGGINPAVTIPQSDVCINGMFLLYACYFGADEKDLRSVVDFVIANRMSDGGFNCMANRSGAVHSSLHTTLSILEGIEEYARDGYSYRVDELRAIARGAVEFILLHRLFLSDHTSEIIDPKFLRFTYPYRWKYTILRALDFLRASEHPYDPRMDAALRLVLDKRDDKGQWKLQSRFPGEEPFIMEKVGAPSRWITLICSRILVYYRILV
jgi:hypothetical protein